MGSPVRPGVDHGLPAAARASGARGGRRRRRPRTCGAPAHAGRAGSAGPANQESSVSSRAQAAGPSWARVPSSSCSRPGTLDELAAEDADLQQLLQRLRPAVGAVVQHGEHSPVGGQVDQDPEHRGDRVALRRGQVGRHPVAQGQQVGPQHEEVVVGRGLPLPAVAVDRDVDVRPQAGGAVEPVVARRRRRPSRARTRARGRAGADQPGGVVVAQVLAAPRPARAWPRSRS